MVFLNGKFRTYCLFSFILIGVISCHASTPPPTESIRNIATPTQRPYVIHGITYSPLPSSAGYTETGIASWYGPNFHGKRTSNGERYNMNGATAAHKLLPMNTMLQVKNLENGRETVVRINDRGPFVRGRIIDLSYAEAKKLGIVKSGTAKVQLTALAPSHDGRQQNIDLQHGTFYVQIGAFSQQKNAALLKQRFIKAGFPTEIHPFETETGATFYRVQVYAGEYLDSARRAERSLLNKGYSGAFVVAK